MFFNRNNDIIPIIRIVRKSDVMTQRINLHETENKTAIRIMIAEADVPSIAALARNVGIKETTLRSALANNTLRVEDMANIADHLGYDLIIEKRGVTVNE